LNQLEQGYTLRAQHKFKEARDAFLAAANATDNLIEKAWALLNAATTLTATHEFESSRAQVATVRELVSLAKSGTHSPSDLDELLSLDVSTEIEEAEILSAEGRDDEALAEFTATLHKFGSRLLESPNRLITYDDLQKRRAYLLVDNGKSAEALPILLEIELRQVANPIFLFYVGISHLNNDSLEKAQDALQKSLALNPNHRIEFQARCSLGMTYYRMGDYARARTELEQGAAIADAEYIRQAQIWKWLEYSCQGLGLVDEAKKYAAMNQIS
jgi:tetratricopeptide (TPR) repeat protein